MGTDNKDLMGSLPELSRQYLRYLATIKGSSALTVKEYTFDLRLFFRFVKSRRLKTGFDGMEELDILDIGLDFIKDITREDIFEFLFFISERRGNFNAARARKLSAIRGFFKYLNKQVNKIENNPAENIDYPSIKQALPKYLSLEESVMLLQAVGGDEKNKHRVRDLCIVTLFLNCGMRLSELVGMNLNDISQDLTSVRIIGKGRKERFVYLNEPSQKALADYLKLRAELENVSDAAAVFISKNYRRISNSGVQKMLEKSFEKAGLAGKHYSTHKLRHTAATLMYQHGGVDTRVLQEILGHEHLNTTQIYTHVANAQLKDAVSMNPLANIKIEDGVLMVEE